MIHVFALPVIHAYLEWGIMGATKPIDLPFLSIQLTTKQMEQSRIFIVFFITVQHHLPKVG